MLRSRLKYVNIHSRGEIMSDRLKNRERFSTTLEKGTVKMLKEYSDKTMIPISKIVDVAIKEYINIDKNHH